MIRLSESKWVAWEIQTSKRWSDVEDVLKFINIDFIDYDHKMLVEFALQLNQLLDRSGQEFSMDLIEETKVLLEELYQYAEDHFNREEQFMALYQLPKVDMHVREHKRILELLVSALNDYKAGKVKLTNQLKYQVMDWLINHINVTDYEFFNISNWSKNIINATSWEDVKPIIRLIGIGEIDTQHRKLTEIALENLKLINAQSSSIEINEAFKHLLNYANFHFDYEAQFIEKYHIPNTEVHHQEHDHFIDTIKKYSSEMQVDFSHFNEMKEWLLMWWINHINTTDRLCFDYKNWAIQLMESAEKLQDVEIVLRYTGIDFIDQDHLHLMDLTLELNKLIGTYDKTADVNLSEKKEGINDCLSRIYKCAEDHFKREEKLMEEQHMRDLVSHQAEHKGILEKLESLIENFKIGRIVLSGNIKTMILEWWIQHTNTTDYRTFVQNNSAVSLPEIRTSSLWDSEKKGVELSEI